MNYDTIGAIVFSIVFSVGVGIVFVKTIFEMLELILSKKPSEMPSMTRKSESGIRH